MADPDVLTRPGLLSALLASALSLLPAAPASALEVSPLRLSLEADQRHGELWLYNDSAAPWRGQARLYQWTQTLDAEDLQPAVGVAVSPAELYLPAQARQRVRVVRLEAPPLDEQGYRLILRAGPDSPPIQLSLPVFVVGAQAQRGPALSARVLPGTDPAVLELHNGGQRHARVADLSFAPAQGSPRPLLPGLSGYVLAGQTRRWTLPGPAAAYQNGQFSARLGENAQAPLPAATDLIAADASPGL